MDNSKASADEQDQLMRRRTLTSDEQLKLADKDKLAKPPSFKSLRTIGGTGVFKQQKPLLSQEEVEELQDKGGFLKQSGIKSVLYKFIKNKIKSIDVTKIKQEMEQEKTKEQQENIFEKAENLVREQIMQLSQQEEQKLQRIAD